MNRSSLEVVAFAFAAASVAAAEPARARFEVSFAPAVRASAVDGRVYVLLSRDPVKEPRFQIHEGIDSQQIFGWTCSTWPRARRRSWMRAPSAIPRRASRRLLPGSTRSRPC